jgi:hypothetical protein
MNERIKQLVKEAGGEFWKRLENDVVNPEAYITFDPPQSLEKFAELIVRECADVACEHMELNEGVDYNVGEKIREHFGVEE